MNVVVVLIIFNSLYYLALAEQLQSIYLHVYLYVFGSRVEMKRLCEIFTRMFADPHSKVTFWNIGMWLLIIY